MADDPSTDEPAPAPDPSQAKPAAAAEAAPERKKKRAPEDPPSDAAETPRKKKRRPEGDLTSSDVGATDEPPRKKRARAEGDLTSSDVGAADPPKKKRPKAEGDLTSSDDAGAGEGGAPKKRKPKAEGDLTSSDSDAGAAPKKKKPSSDDADAGEGAVRKKKAEGKVGASSDATLRKPPPNAPPAAAGAAEEADPAAAAQEAEDALVGLFAVKEGLCTEAQVERAQSKQRAAAAEGEKKPLARVLVEAGTLTPAARDKVLGLIDPEVIPGYRIVGEAGRGGMGVVYKARQLSMDRIVAVKILARRLSNDPGYVTKFLAEARVAGKLNHENIVAAIDAGAAAGLHYFVMEFVSGKSVAEVIEEGGPLPCERAFEVAEQVARGLTHAHQAGLVHRDVKPENVLLASDGRAKLCDLGLAKAAQVAGTGGKSDMTEGTPYYCSPEQALGRTDIDARSDIYSLGCTIYHFLKGEPPYDGDTPRSILVKQVREPFPDLDQNLPDVPAPLRRLLWEMVKKDREQRLPSMRAFEERVAAARKAEQGGGAAARRGGGGGGTSFKPLALVAVVFVVFLGVGALVAWAIVSGSDDPNVVVTTDTHAPPAPTDTSAATEEPPEDDTDGGGQPRVRRVTEDAPRDPPQRTERATTTTTRAPASEAGRALDAARLAQREDDPAASRDALLEVVRRFPDTPEADEARREARALDKAVFDQGMKRFEALTSIAVRAVRDGNYRQAGDAIDAFAEEWTPRKLPNMADQLATLRRAVEQQAQVRLEEAVKALEGASGDAVAPARRAVDEVLARVPASVAQKFTGRLEALSRTQAARQAEGAWAQVMTRRDEALRRGDRAAAALALTAAKADPALAPLRDKVAAAEADLAEVSRAWDAFDARCAALAEDDKARLRLRQGEVRGRVLEYDSPTWQAKVKPYGQKDQVPLDLRDLHPEELVGLALPASDGRANVLFFLARGVPDAAFFAYSQWLNAGGRDAGGVLAAELQRSLSLAAEADVAAKLDRALAADAPPDLVLSTVAGITASDRAAAAYKQRHPRLQAAYRKARHAQLIASPELLFKGKVEVGRAGVTLRYTFKDPAELLDWAPDKAVDDASALRLDDQGMLVKGKVSHIAQFQGGELSVELRATSSSGRQPNLNVVLGDRGGWTGVLLGLGFAYGAMDDLRVDPTAPRKPGYTVPLPANVCIVLDGREPRVDGPNFAAETAPSVQGSQGRAHKFDAARGADGSVRLRLRGREVFRLPPVPDWDRPSAVALAPFQTDIVVHDLEIVGKLDEAWVAARAEFVAAAESVAVVPPPK